MSRIKTIIAASKAVIAATVIGLNPSNNFKAFVKALCDALVGKGLDAKVVKDGNGPYNISIEGSVDSVLKVLSGMGWSVIKKKLTYQYVAKKGNWILMVSEGLYDRCYIGFMAETAIDLKDLKPKLQALLPGFKFKLYTPGKFDDEIEFDFTGGKDAKAAVDAAVKALGGKVEVRNKGKQVIVVNDDGTYTFGIENDSKVLAAFMPLSILNL